MALTDTYDFQFLANEAENFVFDELERQLAACPETVCRCQDCVADMAAIALNMVKPMYRYSLLGTLYTSHAITDESVAANVKEAVTTAIDKVKDNPSHS
jgi:competence protein ComFB